VEHSGRPKTFVGESDTLGVVVSAGDTLGLGLGLVEDAAFPPGEDAPQPLSMTKIATVKVAKTVREASAADLVFVMSTS